MLTQPRILIVDLGCQYSQVIARTLREAGFRSVLLSSSKANDWLETNTPSCVILSGSGASVHDTNAPQPPEKVFQINVPILGICYGMQWLGQRLGAMVAGDTGEKEYGPAEIVVTNDGDLFAGTPDSQNVWASHGDSVTTVPEGATVIAHAKGQSATIRAFHHAKNRWWGIQFHPEVEQTEHGRSILINFVGTIAGCTPDWNAGNIIADIRGGIASDARAILGFSGGVDSTTIAALLAPVMGERLLGVCIDAGHLREGEMDVIRAHAAAAGITLRVIDAAETFIAALAGITDAEKKRRVFKRCYREALVRAAEEFEAGHIVQGTLATDLIESSATGASLIKSHHNVGIDWGDLEELHPLAALFKYEVRALAAELELPDSVVNREPFPGPGFFVRIVGKEITAERLTLVRWADHQVREILKDAEGAPEISQLVVGLMCINTVCVKGSERAYLPSIAIHGVLTRDFMTATGVKFPEVLRDRIAGVLQQDERVGRVWWDEGPKPPATTEFE